MTLTGIGVAGCGRMGAPMLGALRKASFDAVGFDIRPSSEFGGNAPHMRELSKFSQNLRILITVVRDIAQTDAVLFETQRLTEAPNLQTIIVCSTLSPRYTTALRDRVPATIALIDAPMSGAAIAAEQARLSFMLGGSTPDLDHHQPLFDAMGAHFHRMGSFGTGMQAKVLNNLLAASNTAMTRLVLDWAEQAGLDENALLGLIETSSGQNWLASGFQEIEFSRDGYGAENSIGILHKDVASALDAAPPDADINLPRAIQHALLSLKTKR